MRQVNGQIEVIEVSFVFTRTCFMIIVLNRQNHNRRLPSQTQVHQIERDFKFGIISFLSRLSNSNFNSFMFDSFLS